MNKRKIRRLFSITLLFILTIIVYNQNIFNIKFNVENSNVYQRIIATNLEDESRFVAWGPVFKGIFQNPLGGKETDITLRYAHNLWLDVGYDAGILPFILLSIFTLIAFIVIVKFMLNMHPVFIKTLVLTMSVAFIYIFMFEPIMQGFGVYFTIFCFFIGVVQRMNYLYYCQIEKNKSTEPVSNLDLKSD